MALLLVFQWTLLVYDHPCLIYFASFRGFLKFFAIRMLRTAEGLEEANQRVSALQINVEENAKLLEVSLV